MAKRRIPLATQAPDAEAITEFAVEFGVVVAARPTCRPRARVRGGRTVSASGGRQSKMQSDASRPAPITVAARR